MAIGRTLFYQRRGGRGTRRVVCGLAACGIYLVDAPYQAVLHSLTKTLPSNQLQSLCTARLKLATCPSVDSVLLQPHLRLFLGDATNTGQFPQRNWQLSAPAAAASPHIQRRQRPSGEEKRPSPPLLRCQSHDAQLSGSHQRLLPLVKGWKGSSDESASQPERGTRLPKKKKSPAGIRPLCSISCRNSRVSQPRQSLANTIVYW